MGAKGGAAVEFVTMLFAVVSLAVSTICSGIAAYLQLKKSNEPPKDEVWETATRMICARGGASYAEEFADLYLELKFLKEHPEALEGHLTIREAMNARDNKPAEIQAQED